MSLDQNSITFGKYKGHTLVQVLRDRNYCKWLVDQDWFKTSYEYLYNRIISHKPELYFKPQNIQFDPSNFMDTFIYFFLVKPDQLTIDLPSCDKSCYEFYLKILEEIQDKIYQRLENDEENPYDIKAPVKWLQRFERECGIPRESFKEFLGAYELANITTIIEEIKKQGGIEYKGAKSYLIAKNKSKEQEKWWEDILRKKYGENISPQYNYKKCMFDFLNIKTGTIFEVKLGLKDFNNEQHKKYQTVLGAYRIIYLIDRDCVIDTNTKKIYSTNPDKYHLYIKGIPTKKKQTYLDEIIILENYLVIGIDDISSLFGDTTI